MASQLARNKPRDNYPVQPSSSRKHHPLFTLVAHFSLYERFDLSDFEKLEKDVDGFLAERSANGKRVQLKDLIYEHTNGCDDHLLKCKYTSYGGPHNHSIFAELFGIFQQVLGRAVRFEDEQETEYEQLVQIVLLRLLSKFIGLEKNLRSFGKEKFLLNFMLRDCFFAPSFRLKVYKILLEAGANPNCVRQHPKKKFVTTPIFCEMKSNTNLEILRLLLSYGARFDVEAGHENETPLMQTRSIEIAKFLVEEAGVSVSQRTPSGKTALLHFTYLNSYFNRENNRMVNWVVDYEIAQIGSKKMTLAESSLITPNAKGVTPIMQLLRPLRPLVKIDRYNCETRQIDLIETIPSSLDIVKKMVKVGCVINERAFVSLFGQDYRYECFDDLLETIDFLVKDCAIIPSEKTFHVLRQYVRSYGSSDIRQFAEAVASESSPEWIRFTEQQEKLLGSLPLLQAYRTIRQLVSPSSFSVVVASSSIDK
jgi:hypothetical protein